MGCILSNEEEELERDRPKSDVNSASDAAGVGNGASSPQADGGGANAAAASGNPLKRTDDAAAANGIVPKGLDRATSELSLALSQVASTSGDGGSSAVIQEWLRSVVVPVTTAAPAAS